MKTSQTTEGIFFTDKKRAFRDIILSITVIAFFFWFFLPKFEGIKEFSADILILAVFTVFMIVPLIAVYNAGTRLLFSHKPLFVITKDGFLSNFPKAFFGWDEIKYIVVKVKNFKTDQSTLFSPKLRQLVIVTKSERVFKFDVASSGRTSHFERERKIINLAYADTDQQSLIQALQNFYDKTKIHIRTPKLRSAKEDVAGGGVGDLP